MKQLAGETQPGSLVKGLSCIGGLTPSLKAGLWLLFSIKSKTSCHQRAALENSFRHLSLNIAKAKEPNKRQRKSVKCIVTLWYLQMSSLIPCIIESLHFTECMTCWFNIFAHHEFINEKCQCFAMVWTPCHCSIKSMKQLAPSLQATHIHWWGSLTSYPYPLMK